MCHPIGLLHPMPPTRIPTSRLCVVVVCACSNNSCVIVVVVVVARFAFMEKIEKELLVEKVFGI